MKGQKIMTEKVVINLSLEEWIEVFQMDKSSHGFLGIRKILCTRDLVNILEWLEHMILYCKGKNKYEWRDGELMTKGPECHDT